MSALAAQIILHPNLSQSLAVLATTNGRDKAYRLVQYVSRLLAWYFLRRGNVDASAKWDGLKAGLANGRRAMRLLRSAEFLQSGFKLAAAPITSLNGAGQLAHIAQIARQVGYGGYLGADMLVWLGSIRFLKYDKDKMARLQRLTFQFWLFGILSSLVSGTASMVKLRADSRRFMLSAEMARREAYTGGSEKSPEVRAREEEERREKGRGLLIQRQQLLSQLISDSLDVWIPATNLGFTHLNDGVLGFFGAVTSYMALQKIWPKHAAAGSRKTI